LELKVTFNEIKRWQGLPVLSKNCNNKNSIGMKAINYPKGLNENTP
jgi:hypothetical protein